HPNLSANFSRQCTNPDCCTPSCWTSFVRWIRKVFGRRSALTLRRGAASCHIWTIRRTQCDVWSTCGTYGRLGDSRVGGLRAGGGDVVDAVPAGGGGHRGPPALAAPRPTPAHAHAAGHGAAQAGGGGGRAGCGEGQRAAA